MFGWFKKARLPLQPEGKWVVAIEGDRISIRDESGQIKSVTKSNLSGVAIGTNDSGPWGADVWWMLFDATDQMACAFPQGAAGEDAVIAWLTALPSFDHGEMIRAMGSTDNAVFAVWRKEPMTASHPICNFVGLALILVGFGLASSSSAQVKPANPNDPYDYLPRVNLAFEEFWKRYHYYPSYWYDITENCREKPHASLCDFQRREPAHERRIMKPLSSKYSYEIVASSRNTYRVVAVNALGCRRFSIDQRKHVEPIRSAC